ncbi:MAG TPA: 6-bladed beta-propeller [Longimicrobiales bacterium]|nr:6-bladed beta-propeller [Longimicrobiales bacterium]
MKIAILAVLPLVAGCLASGDDSRRPPAEPVDDGVVVGGRGAWAPDDAWTVEEVLSVGGLDSGVESQFGVISGVDVDGAGNIYVADKQIRNVRVFDAAGAYLRTMGRPGEGPGEFGSNIGGVFVLGDEVVVPDASSARVSRFGLDGAFLASDPVRADRGIPIRWDVAGGRLVAQRRRIVPGDRTATVGDAVVTLGLEGGPVDTLATLPAGQSVQVTGGLPRIRQFEPEPVWDTTVDGRLVTAMTDAWRFEVRDASGALEWIASRPTDVRRVTERQREAVRRSLREMYRRQGVPPALSQEVLDGMEFADDLPALASVTFGPYGSLWVQDFTPPDAFEDGRVRVSVHDMGSPSWSVFDAAGHYLGVVTFPVDFRPTRVVGDRFYGIARDALDVQTVRVFRISTE